MRVLPALLLLLCGVASWPARAQAPASPPPVAESAAPGSARPEKRIERIRVEDAGSRIDEVRYGGETQSITVDTKGALPSYEVVPANGARNRPAGERDAASGTSGQRVWKLVDF